LKRAHKIIVSLVIGLIAGLQFIPIKRNVASGESQASISSQLPMSDSIHQVLQNACFNCHSNNTRYPWYANVQPVGLWLERHIQNGKRGLNFDEFARYPPRRQYRKYFEIKEQLAKNEMPLASYTLIHRSARITPEQLASIDHWCDAMRDSMKVHFPHDSLERRTPLRK
jgi:hypothetical protein